MIKNSALVKTSLDVSNYETDIQADYEAVGAGKNQEGDYFEKSLKGFLLFSVPLYLR